MDEPLTGIALILAIASDEARAQMDAEVAPRHLFAALFDVCAGQTSVSGEPSLPRDHFAGGLLRDAGAGATALLAALASSPTMVGRVLRTNTRASVHSASPWSAGDLLATRTLLAPAGPPGDDFSPGLAPIEGGGLAPRAATSFGQVSASLATRGIRLTVISAHRTTTEQREDYEVITEFTKGSPLFPVGAPGTSLHERGLAVDVAYDGYLRDFRAPTVSNNLEAIRAAFRDHGWYQFDPTNDPYHFAYGRIG